MNQLLGPVPPGLDVSSSLNALLDGWNRAMGLRFTHATTDSVIAELTIGPEHRQPYGLVHGGVYAGMVETVCSVGAALDALGRGQTAVGLDNHTSFLHATRDGRLRVTARALTRGKRSQLWDAVVEDDQGRAVATGRVRMLCLDAGATAGGETVALKPPAEQ